MQSRGRLRSPPFEITQDYLNFLIGGGAHPGQSCVNLIVDDRVMRTATGSNAEALECSLWHVRPWRGRQAVLEIVDDAFGE